MVEALKKSDDNMKASDFHCSIFLARSIHLTVSSTMALVFLEIDGNLKPCFAEAGKVIKIIDLDDTPVERFDLSKMTVAELRAVLSACDCEQWGRGKTKAAMIETIFGRWNALLTNLRNHRARQAMNQPEPAPSVLESDLDSSVLGAATAIPDDGTEGDDIHTFDDAMSSAESELSVSDFFDIIDVSVEDLENSPEYHDGEFDPVYLKDGGDFAPPKTVRVEVKEPKGRTLLHFRFVDVSMTMEELKEKIANETQRLANAVQGGSKRGLTPDMFRLHVAGQVMKGSISDHIHEEDRKITVELELRIRGGGIRPTQKAHLKPETALKELIKRSNQMIEKKVEQRMDASAVPPDPIQAFLKPIKDRMSALKSKMDDNTNTIKAVLENLGESKLTTILDVFEGKGNTVSTEQKICLVADVIWDDIAVISEGIPHLQNQKVEMLEALVGEYAKHYSVSKPSGLCYSNERFISDVREVLTFRKGMKSVMASDGEASASDRDDGKCHLM